LPGMIFTPKFPTDLHRDAAELIKDYFLSIPQVDTVLVVNSCARGKAVPESDLDFAILVKPGTTSNEINEIHSAWSSWSTVQPAILKYKKSSRFSHIHLDVIDGNYIPMVIEVGEPIDYFEIEIGNQICCSAPMGSPGTHFRDLQTKWLPFYDGELASKRLVMVINACTYDLDHIPFFMKRGLYFQSFEILYKAFQEYLQALFISNRTYPIAYNKWIKEQVVEWLNKADLYPRLSPILSIDNIESNDINVKAKMLKELLLSIEN
jgi:predicted nucleotidyltransferase